jgi:S-adenosylmethionine:tRNA ribosyltransferase-isomerase
MSSFETLLAKYNYTFPENLIAQKPAKPRDSARLLVCDKKNSSVQFDIFRNLGRYLPRNAVLVFNQTKVLPARIFAQKRTGGKVELLYLGYDSDSINFLSNRPIADELVVLFKNKKTKYTFKVIGKAKNGYLLNLNFPISEINTFLAKYGQTPLPPYIKNSPLSEKQKRKEYQAVFAKAGEAIAAPTASLHFTKKLMVELKKQGIDIKFVRLDVGLGTFAPLKEYQVKAKKLHQEYYYIDKKTADFLNQAKKEGRPIIAVGTTVARTLETAVNSLSHLGEGRGEATNKKIKSISQLTTLSAQSDLFISKGYKFKFIDGLITNFHVPKSSLMMLVSALVGRKKLLNIYKKAIEKKFRLFSFGDGMLILPK